MQLARPAPKYELTPLELSKRSGDEVRELLFSEMRRLFVEARNVLPQQVREFWGDSLLARGRMLLIHTIDERWVEYVHAMDALKEGIGYRGYAGVDPKVAYKKEGGEMFMTMVMTAKENFARQFGASLRGGLEGYTSRVGEVYANVQARQTMAASAYQAPRPDQPQARPAGPGSAKQAPIRTGKIPGRNDPCPCGAKDKDGRPIKYKKCHGRSA
jgi:preprotein translocase subunit SecA